MEIKGLKILVVDDNHDTAQSMAELLSLLGHITEVAYDGTQAVEVAASFQPEIVLLDIGLPVVDGYEVARRLREDVGLRDATLIALTGYGREEDRDRAHQAGFDRHFTKPIDLTQLQELLDQRMQGR